MHATANDCKDPKATRLQDCCDKTTLYIEFNNKLQLMRVLQLYYPNLRRVSRQKNISMPKKPPHRLSATRMIICLGHCMLHSYSLAMH